MPEKSEKTTFKVPGMKKNVLYATVEGDDEYGDNLLTDRLPPGVVMQVLRKQLNLPPLEEEQLSLEELFERSIYRLGNGEMGLPAYAFKKAMVRAAGSVPGVHMTNVRGNVHVLGELVPLRCAEPELFIADERNVNKKVVAAIYAKYPFPWEADLKILYVPQSFSKESIVNLLSIAGFVAGVGCRRPENGGTNGMFKVKEIWEKGDR